MKAKIWTALIAVYIAWGSTYLAIRFAVETIPPFLMAGTRFLIAAILLYAWRRSAGDQNPTPRQWRSAIIVGLLLLVGGNGIVSWAEQYVVSSIAALIVASVPIWMVIIDALRPGSLKPDWRVILGVLIGFGGIALLAGSTHAASNPDRMAVYGIPALLGASIFWAFGSVFSHHTDMPTSTLTSIAIQMFAGGVGLYLLAILTGEWTILKISEITTRSLVSLGYLIVFGALIGFVCYAWLLRNAPLPLVSTYAYVNPVIALIVGSWLGAELLSLRTVIAAVIIVGSVILINTSSQTRVKDKEETAALPAD